MQAWWRQVVLAWALAMPLAAMAQVHRCPDAQGATVWQQTPCAGGVELQVRPIPMLGGTLLGDRAEREAAHPAPAVSSRKTARPQISARPAPPVRGCPSSHTIRNAEVAANSITLSPPERRRRMAEVARMKACRN